MAKGDNKFMQGALQKSNQRMSQHEQDKATIASYPSGTGKLYTAGDPDDDYSKAVERDYEYSKADPSSFKKGGRVRKGGMAMVHKGERVIPKHKIGKSTSRRSKG